jgi:autotransporter-associated beta strand protein
VTTLENTAHQFTASDFGFSDPSDTPNSNSLKAVKITTLPTKGSLTRDGVPVVVGDFLSAADVDAGRVVFTPARDGFGSAYATFTFQVQDDGGTANGGVDLDSTPRKMTINVTAVRFANATTSLAETIDTSQAIRLADIVLADDLESTYVLSLTGTDAADFEIVEGVLFLKKGVVLDYETRNCRVVTINVTDTSVSASPSASLEFVLQVTRANDSPTAVSLANAVTSLPESTSTAERIMLADIVVTDAEANPIRNAVNSVMNVDRIPAQSARYVKFSILATSNGSQPSIDELEVYATDGRNLALAAVPSSSGNLPGYAEHALDYLNDGLTRDSRSWISDTSDTGWVVLDLQDVEMINKIIWGRDRSGTFTDRVATSYRIEVSADGVTWQTVASEWDRLPFGSSQSVTNDMLATPPGVPQADGTISLSGSNADLFEVVGTTLALRAGTILDFDTKSSYAVTIRVGDATANVTPVSVDYTLTITPAAQGPMAEVNVPAGQTQTDTTVRTGNEVIVKRGGGTVILDLANTHTGGLVVEEGEVVIRNIAALNGGPLEIRAGATVTLDTGTVRVPISALVLDSTGQIDLQRAGLVVAAGGSTTEAIRQAIIAGRNGGNWAGATGITSAAAAAIPGRAIGYAPGPNGSTIIAFAAAGDTNLDNQVNVVDLVAISSAGVFGRGAVASWSQGDMNYDGVTNVVDLVSVNTSGTYDTGNYNTAPASGQVAEAMVATLELQATKAPEPNEVVPSGSFLNLAFTAMAVEQDATRSLNAKKKVFAQLK